MTTSLPPSPTVKILQIVGGIFFLAVWILFHLTWMYLAGVANLMANDSGAATAGQQMSLIGGMFAGQVIDCLAGVPAALAFFWRGRRKLLLMIFAILFVTGTLWQVWAFHAFFSGMAGKLTLNPETGPGGD